MKNLWGKNFKGGKGGGGGGDIKMGVVRLDMHDPGSLALHIHVLYMYMYGISEAGYTCTCSRDNFEGSEN